MPQPTWHGMPEIKPTYYGLPQIARRLQWGENRVRRYKLAHPTFPIYRSVRGLRWVYTMDEVALRLWWQALALEATEHLETTALGKKRATRHARAEQQPTEQIPPSTKPQ